MKKEDYVVEQTIQVVFSSAKSFGIFVLFSSFLCGGVLDCVDLDTKVNDDTRYTCTPSTRTVRVKPRM